MPGPARSVRKPTNGGAARLSEPGSCPPLPPPDGGGLDVVDGRLEVVDVAAQLVDVVLTDLNLAVGGPLAGGDRAHPRLEGVEPVAQRGDVVLGGLRGLASDGLHLRADRAEVVLGRALVLGLHGEHDPDDPGRQRQDQRQRAREAADPEPAVELGDPRAQSLDLLLDRLRGRRPPSRWSPVRRWRAVRPSSASPPSPAPSRSRGWRVASRPAASGRRSPSGGRQRRSHLATLGLERAAVGLPGLESAGDVVGVEAGLAQGLGGHPGAVAAAAVEEHRAARGSSSALPARARSSRCCGPRRSGRPRIVRLAARR